MLPLSRNNPPPPPLQSALAWLNARPAEDPLHDLPPLHGHLRDIMAAGMPPLQRLRVLELFQLRTDIVARALRPQLLSATLPLVRQLRTISRGLIDVHGLLAAGYLGILRETDPARLTQPKRSVASLCASALANLARQQEVALLVAASIPANLWLQAQTAFHALKDSLPPDATLSPEAIAADHGLKRMLALAAAQPETFAARELAFLLDYLASFATTVEIRPYLPEPADNWYWLEESRDLPPVAAARRQPPAGGILLCSSCATLAELARSHIGLLAKGERPESIGLPAVAAAEDYRHALERAEIRWRSPLKRHFHRRNHHYRVQICAQLGNLWRLLRAGDVAEQDSVPISEWMVLNESPGGFGTMHVSGELEGLVAGSLIGLRRSPDQSWNVCLVRWGRSDNPEHVELGIELVSPSATPVRIALRGRDAESTPVAALLLPALPALERSEALLTGRGHYAGSRFTLLREVDGKLQLTECQAQRPVLQTATVELFEFERDFLPR